jgi:hypothetical protein
LWGEQVTLIEGLDDHLNSGAFFESAAQCNIATTKEPCGLIPNCVWSENNKCQLELYANSGVAPTFRALTAFASINLMFQAFLVYSLRIAKRNMAFDAQPLGEQSAPAAGGGGDGAAVQRYQTDF